MDLSFVLTQGSLLRRDFRFGRPACAPKESDARAATVVPASGAGGMTSGAPLHFARLRHRRFFLRIGVFVVTLDPISMRRHGNSSRARRLTWTAGQHGDEQEFRQRIGRGKHLPASVILELHDANGFNLLFPCAGSALGRGDDACRVLCSEVSCVCTKSRPQSKPPPELVPLPQLVP
jgi:hypothetical protein